mmetsp:Transcript_39950/g.92020  ORF Transcript_39950/g.92020 Transcript_39950/m.92020 type:complete len:164 (-) Transcript_39950:31-522(-)
MLLIQRWQAKVSLVLATFASLTQASLDLLEHHVERLTDDDKYTVQDALDNIRDLGEHVDDDGMHIVEGVIGMLDHEDKYVNEHALEALANMPEFAAKYWDKIHHLSWNHEDKYVRGTAYKTLTAMVPHKKRWKNKEEGGASEGKKRKRRKRKSKAASESSSDL